MIGIMRIFFGSRETNPWLVLGGLMLAGLFSGIGLTSLLPLLTMAIEGEMGSESTAQRLVADGLAFFKLEPRLGTLLIIVISGITMKCLISMAAMKYVGYALAEIATGLRTRLIKQVLNVQWGYLTHQPIGRIANAVSADATRSGQAYHMAAQFQINVIQTVVYCLVAALVSWKLALAALVLGGLIALSLNFLVRITRKAGRRQTERTSELVIYLSDALGNLKPIKAMGKSVV